MNKLANNQLDNIVDILKIVDKLKNFPQIGKLDFDLQEDKNKLESLVIRGMSIDLKDFFDDCVNSIFDYLVQFGYSKENFISLICPQSFEKLSVMYSPSFLSERYHWKVQ